MTEQNPSIKWSEFVRRKFHSQRDLMKALEGRLESGYSSHMNLDLDLYPLISEWNDNPWTFTTYGCCSGTPREHRREGYGPVNGCKGNPHAGFSAHSYMNHPMFPLFNAWVNSSSQGAVDRSGPHSLKDYAGIYLHLLNINVPQEVIAAKDMAYLERFWQTLKMGIWEFKSACNARSEHERFERSLPVLERRFIDFIGQIEKPVIITTRDNREYRALLEDVHPYSAISVNLKQGQGTHYFSLDSLTPEGVKKIEGWQGEELFNAEWLKERE